MRVRGGVADRLSYGLRFTTFSPLTPALSPFGGEGGISARAGNAELCESLPI